MCKCVCVGVSDNLLTTLHVRDKLEINFLDRPLFNESYWNHNILLLIKVRELSKQFIFTRTPIGEEVEEEGEMK